MATIVCEIPHAEASRLRGELEGAGFQPHAVQYAEFSVKGPSVTVTYYTKKRKLVVQGSGAEDFVATFLGDGAVTSNSAASSSGGTSTSSAAPAAADIVDAPIIGTDESGKGDYFGPLVVAAVLIRPEDVPVLRELGVRDSKAVTDRNALLIADQIEQGWTDRVSVVAVQPPRYNELRDDFGGNLNRMLAWCHARAIEDVLEVHPCEHALSDKFGAESLIRNALMERGQGLQLAQRVRAESHPAVAAASIVARARFLRDLDRLGRTAGTKLPKGAGWPVDAAARELFREGGVERLRPVAKLHFKTTEKAMR